MVLDLQSASPTGIVTWQAPPTTGGSDLLGYVIQRRQTYRSDVANAASSPMEHYVNNTGNLLQSYTSNDLSTGYVYGFRIAAMNAMGTSSFTSSSLSTDIVATLPTQILTTPTIVDPKPTLLTLSWVEPVQNDGSSGDGGSDLLGYQIFIRTGGTGVFENFISNTNSTTLNKTITGLIANNIYEFKVSAINAAGVGEPSLSSGTATSFVVSQLAMLGSETSTSFTTERQDLFREALALTINVPMAHIIIVSVKNILDTDRRRRMLRRVIVSENGDEEEHHIVVSGHGTSGSSHSSHSSHNSHDSHDSHDSHSTHRHGRRLATVGITIEVNITGVTASDAGSTNAAMQTSVSDGTLLANVGTAGLSTFTTATLPGNSTVVETAPTATTAPPVAPLVSSVAPTFADVGSGRITLSWAAPTDNGGNEVTGYKIAAYLDAKEGKFQNFLFFFSSNVNNSK